MAKTFVQTLPTAEQEGIALICSWAVSLGLRLKAADINKCLLSRQAAGAIAYP